MRPWKGIAGKAVEEEGFEGADTIEAEMREMIEAIVEEERESALGASRSLARRAPVTVHGRSSLSKVPQRRGNKIRGSLVGSEPLGLDIYQPGDRTSCRLFRSSNWLAASAERRMQSACVVTSSMNSGRRSTTSAKVRLFVEIDMLTLERFIKLSVLDCGLPPRKHPRLKVESVTARTRIDEAEQVQRGADHRDLA